MRLLTATTADVARLHAIVRTTCRRVVAVTSDILIHMLIVLHHRWLIMAICVRIVLPEF